MPLVHCDFKTVRVVVLQATTNGPWSNFRTHNASWLWSLSNDDLCERERALAELQARKQRVQEMRSARMNVNGFSNMTIAAAKVLNPSKSNLYENPRNS